MLLKSKDEATMEKRIAVMESRLNNEPIGGLAPKTGNTKLNQPKKINRTPIMGI